MSFILLYQRFTLPLFTAAAVGIMHPTRAEVVFDSLASSTPQVLNAFSEIGDEIFLGGEARTITRLRMEYFATLPFGANVTARLRIYENDGEPPAGFPPTVRSPRTLLFSTPDVPVRSGFGTFDVSGVLIDVPRRFTVSLQFSGLPQGSFGNGPLIYGLRELNVGSSFDDYWIRQANGTWNTSRFPNGLPPVNFAMLIEAEPDPPIRMLGLSVTNARPVIRISGPITSNVVVESAPTVAGPWSPWSTNRFTNGPIRLTDPRGTADPARFFRARHP